MSFVEYVLFQLKDIDESELTTAEKNILKEARIQKEIERTTNALINEKENQDDRPE